MQRLTGCRKGPLADEVKFGGRWAVAVGAEVEADPFDTVEEEVAFLGVKRESPLSEDVTDAREVEDECVGVVGEEEDVVDNLAVARLDEVEVDGGMLKVGKFLAEESLPFLAKNEHEGSVAGWGINRPEGHDVESEEDAVGAGEAKFGAIRVADTDLVETGFGVNANPI